jgi:hypothetical protein
MGERYHKFEILRTCFVSLKAEKLVKSSVTHKDDDGRDMVFESYNYGIFQKDKNYIAYGTFSHWEDNQSQLEEVSETIYPFNKDGFIEPVFKRKYHNNSTSGETSNDIPINPSCLTLEDLTNCQSRWLKEGIVFDPVQKKILSWD